MDLALDAGTARRLGPLRRVEDPFAAARRAEPVALRRM